jgi:uncharacterized OB-fold protein
MTYLAQGLPTPIAEDDGLDAPYWDGARQHKLMVQRCAHCGTYQWGSEWICHKCLSYDVEWVEIEGKGRIYSWERAWHPIHSALKEQGPYLVILVELPHAGNIRMIGNLLGDPHQAVEIGTPVTAVFEDHGDADERFTLVQWTQ